MKLQFTKMHGAGNDFVVIDNSAGNIALSGDQIKQIADRHFGVGCDQLLMVETATSTQVDFRYRIFNADGGEVEQCGNGARCFVRFVVEKGLTKKHQIDVETAGGIITLLLQNNGQVTVNMGIPDFEPTALPFSAAQQQSQYALPILDKNITISALSMGNPHAVMLVDDVEKAPVTSLGPQIESHPLFPKHVNAGFMQVSSKHTIYLRVYERGSGETLACGSGACAAVVSGIQLNLLASPVTVHTRGGRLHIEWAGEGRPVMMTGPAEIVFEGEIEI